MPTLDFKGKSIIYSHHLRVPFRDLKIDLEKSFSSKDKTRKKRQPSLDDNLIIHGDNLHTLKALLPRYAGKIKCIYIDPPYNTGNENWVYNDKVNSPLIKEWLKQNGIGSDDLERHDKWLCMMWPRLQLLRELLSDDGVIFISIDDNEQSALKSILDEIFGEESFLAQIIVKSNPGGRDYGGVALTHDYVLAYSKKPEASLNLVWDRDKKFSLKDKLGGFEARELRNRNIKFNKDNRPNLYYPFYVEENNPDENALYNVSLTRKEGFIKVLPLKSQGVQTVWRWGKEKSQLNLNTNVKAKKKRDGTFMIIEKYRSHLSRERSIFDEKNIRNEEGTLYLKSIFQNEALPFEYPKSHYLIKRLINLGSDKDSIILDSFSGSGTTAHAVLDLNKEDNGNRKFILVECEDYADKITAERVRRVIRGVPRAKDGKLKRGLGGSFAYCTLGDEISEENLLKATDLPSYEQLAKYVYYTATGESLIKVPALNKEWFIGEANGYNLHLIYKPDEDFLTGRESALNFATAEKIKQFNKKNKKTIVFASHHCFTQKELKKDYNIHFCHLPYDIHRIVGA